MTPGFTIGLVVVPQAMAYALLAQLPPAYGLYTSFTGAVLYWLFGTSKDIVIGVCFLISLQDTINTDPTSRLPLLVHSSLVKSSATSTALRPASTPMNKSLMR